MKRQEVVGMFHAQRVILTSSVYSLAIAREKGGNRDAQSQTANTKGVNLSNNQTKTPNGFKTFTFYRLGTATSLFSMGDIDN